jgi:hypothetical protein
MTSSTFKKFDQFVNEELDKFYEELEDTSKNYKVPVNFVKDSSYNYNNQNSMFVDVKKKETQIKKKKIWDKTTGNGKSLF